MSLWESIQAQWSMTRLTREMLYGQASLWKAIRSMRDSGLMVLLRDACVWVLFLAADCMSFTGGVLRLLGVSLWHRSWSTAPSSDTISTSDDLLTDEHEPPLGRPLS